MTRKYSKKRHVPEAGSSQSLPSIRLLAYPVLLVLLNLAAYSNTFQADWQFDDVPNILANSDIQISDLSWNSLVQAAGNRVGGYRPVAYLTFALNYYFFGFSLVSHHSVNLLIHAANALLVFDVVRRISRLGLPSLPTTSHQTLSFFVSAFWSLSPLQTQSVTYIVQRMNLLAALFALLFIRSYLRWRAASTRTNSWRSLAAISIWLLLAIGSKENAVVIPLLALALEWCFPRENSRLSPKVILTGVLGLALLAGAFAWKFGLVQKIQTDYAGREFSLLERLLTQPRVIVFHVTQLILPLPSRLALKHEMTTSTSLFSPPTTLPCILACLALVAWGVYGIRRWTLLSFWTMWFFIGLSAECSFLPLEMIYEHRLYLPSVGFFCACLFPMFGYAGDRKQTVQTRKVQPLLFAVLPVLAALTFHRNIVWKDKVTLWTDNSLKYPKSARVLTNVGTAYAEAGDMTEAEAAFVRAFDADPSYPEARANLALLKANQGELEEALQLVEGLKESRGKRINHEVYFNQGVIYAKSGHTQKAIESYEKAAQRFFRYPETHYNLGLLYLKTGERGKAHLHFRFFVTFWKGSRDDPFFLEGKQQLQELGGM
jgi:protein O-mannosyl-transferase